ncbi:MAG: 4-hydroxy-tetrahydrodipicolinate synthase [Robiginitomaculum sp.]|nr:4-hydroxy-tetrahydrodipicolinate synthase [Robiginitomaculum sp.]MDQ7076625.1 4-hydroxy-tetrahydrodipicolinate synthase [Robiginitomaculum sp.]
MFYGSITALVTPFDGVSLDETGFRAFVKWQLEQGTHGLVPGGTTGEAPVLSDAERRRIIEICLEEAGENIPVIAGAGSNVTAKSCAMAKEAKALGAHAVLVATPYYNKPSQEGLYAHFAAIAEVGIPVILYNVPGRSVVDISVQTMGRLAALEMIVGVKDATADMGRIADQRAQCGADFVQLSGDDFSALGFAAHGGQGCISVTSNVAPGLCAQMQNALRNQDYTRACAINDALQILHRALFADANPAPVKYALSKMGMIQPTLRLPMTEASESARQAVRAALKALEGWRG